MSDAVLAAVAVVLITLVPFDLYVARAFIRAARIRPHMDAVTAFAWIETGIAILAIIAGLLGVHTILVQRFDIRILPVAAPVALLALGLIAVSIPNLFTLRLLRRWVTEARNLHLHRRDGEHYVKAHRRADDIHAPIVSDAEDRYRGEGDH